MAGFNRVILMGNLTRDPELRSTPNGAQICSFGIAVNRKFKKGDEWIEEPTFVDCTVFGPKAEPFAKHFTKGKLAHIEGSLRMETWDDKQTGAKRSKLGVVVENWEFCGGKEQRGDEMPLPPGTRPMASAERNEAPW